MVKLTCHATVFMIYSGGPILDKCGLFLTVI